MEIVRDMTFLGPSMYSKDSIISTVSIKRTVLKFFIMTLLNVPYDLIMVFQRFYRTVSIKRTVWSMTHIYAVCIFKINRFYTQ